jgi:Domain of unknown function (DUF4249)
MLVAGIAAQSCKETELGVELPYAGDRLVVYSELSPEKSVSLYLNQTYPPTGKFTVKEGLEGAKVILIENGMFKETLIAGDVGTYISPSGLKPKVGFTYSFQLVLKGYPDVNTTPVVIPSGVSGINLKLGKDTIPSVNTGNVARKLDVTWFDKKEHQNDYLVTIEGTYEGQYLGTSTFLMGKDADVEDGCSLKRTRQRYIFRDICVNEQKISGTFGLETYGFLQDRNIPSGSRRRNVDEYRIIIADISESYFRYLQDELQPTDIFLAFQLPQSRYSNVNNGYGVVVAYNQSEFVLSVR